MTFNACIKESISKLAPVYDPSESRWLMRIILEKLNGWTQTDIILNGDKEMLPELKDRIEAIISRLLRNEPIQYILGETYWHGLTLRVSPAVLIPREETSELVDIITGENQKDDLAVLDMCTGSGCIAIALARNLSFPEVTGIDISDEALAVARDNAALCKVKINFLKSDVLKPLNLTDNSYDIIVSNPPYIADSEKKSMDANVLDYEPHSALFVPDDDPLKFYRAISFSALRLTRPDGRLYLEINPLYARQLSDMLSADGWRDVTVIKDMHGKDRFISAHAVS
ncbi:peptide chain release factor N(5)-glutamine methyltransferase [uncultured Duncaniella sp.]|uniref:peptide chain release factor N(5)-glutamine methyltransferase n=1 Tax=uncultured Duncaniella sp. TaxID=2768039 RepID=UPI0025F15B83|nr:peptide chain release factor N(5)-glutamine methyltransferase [uncultured Duncaniella sp.]